jgi:hypothetical protein
MRFLRTTFGGMFFFAVAIFASVLISGCQSTTDYVSAMVSGQGVKAESLMPGDSIMVIKMGTDDASQIAAMEELIKKFPAVDFAEFEKAFAEKVDNDPERNGITYEKDLKPLLSKDLRVMLALTGDISKDIAPGFVIALTGSESAKMKALVDRTFPSASDMEKQEYKGFYIYFNKNKDTYYAFYNDVFVLTNRMSLMTAALDAGSTGGGSLLANPSYQKALKKLSGGIGFLYLDVKKYFSSVNGISGEKSSTQVSEDDILNGLEGELMALYPEKNGLRLKMAFYGDETVPNGEGANFFSNNMKPAYLYKQLSGKDLILYMEGYDLNGAIKMEVDLLKNLEGFDKMTSAVNQAFKSVQLDPEKDLLTFMDKGYAFTLYDAGSSIPAVAFYMDASSAPGSARKVLTTIFSSIDKFLQQSTDPEVKKNLKNEKKESTGGDLYAFSVSSPDSGVSFEFDYGLTENSHFYVGLNVPDNMSETLEKNSEFNKIRQYMAGDSLGLFYFETAPLVLYIDRIVEDTFNKGAMTDEDKAMYDVFKSYIAPVKSAVFYGYKPAESMTVMEGFLRIE